MDVKEFKRTYCASWPCLLAELMIIFAPCAIVFDIMYSLIGYIKFGTVILTFALALVLFGVFGVSIMLLMTGFINCFKDASVYIREDKIIYEDKALFLDKIEYVTLYLPHLESKTSASTQELSLYINDKEHIVIKRPSVRLISYIKKRCKNAKFEIYELKSRIRTCAIISAVITVVFPAIIFFSAS